MRAWRVHEPGDPNDVLRLEEVEEPRAGPGEVVVEVEAAALYFFDILPGQVPGTPGAALHPGRRGSRHRCRGEINPLIYESVPFFEELTAALELLGSRKTYGKLVTKPSA